MKAAIKNSLFVAILFLSVTANANVETVSKDLDFKFTALCLEGAERANLASEGCDMTLSSLHQNQQQAKSQNYAESIEKSSSVVSPVSEPNTLALMVLGFGVLSMVAGAKLKNS